MTAIDVADGSRADGAPTGRRAVLCTGADLLQSASGPAG